MMVARIVATVVALALASCGRIGFDASGDGNVTPGGDGAPLDCPNIGDVCADGSIYAGISPDGNVRMYTEATTTNTNGPWTTGTGMPAVTAVLVGLTNTVTGAFNTTQIATGGPFQDSDAGMPGVQPHEAANYCADLTANGRTDWYLPALDELHVLSTNQVEIGNFIADEYWSSNEDPSCPADCAKAIAFPAGTETDFRAKYDYRVLRCVRKD
jgi:hypothetical protein